MVASPGVALAGGRSRRAARPDLGLWAQIWARQGLFGSSGSEGGLGCAAACPTRHLRRRPPVASGLALGHAGLDLSLAVFVAVGGLFLP